MFFLTVYVFGPCHGESVLQPINQSTAFSALKQRLAQKDSTLHEPEKVQSPVNLGPDVTENRRLIPGGQESVRRTIDVRPWSGWAQTVGVLGLGAGTVVVGGVETTKSLVEGRYQLTGAENHIHDRFQFYPYHVILDLLAVHRGAGCVTSG